MSKIRILITGDFCPHQRAEELCLAGNFKEIYGDMLPILQEKDLSVTNLECPLCVGEYPITKSGPHLRAHPKCIELLKYGCFDVVTLANNHIMDHGRQGLKETLHVCRQNGMETVGAAENAKEAGRPFYRKINGIDVAIINMTEHEFSTATYDKPGANTLDPVLNYHQIVAAKERADIVVVIVHGGHEHYNLPSPRMVHTYRYFVDIGASVVVGHHTHCVSGYEVYKDAPIFYSLGNFIFDWRKPLGSAWFEGFLVALEIEKERILDFQIIPYTQFHEKVGLSLMNDRQKERFFNMIQELSSIIQDYPLLLEEWKSFSSSKNTECLTGLFNFGKARRFLLRKGMPAHVLTRNKNWPRLLNLIQCEAHRDILIDNLRLLVQKLTR